MSSRLLEMATELEAMAARFGNHGGTRLSVIALELRGAEYEMQIDAVYAERRCSRWEAMSVVDARDAVPRLERELEETRRRADPDWDGSGPPPRGQAAQEAWWREHWQRMGVWRDP